MLQIGLCDDESDTRFALRCALERILEKRMIDAQIFEFSSGDRLLGWISKHAGKLDLVFLDIEMDGRNGMETAKALRGTDNGLQIVFVTGHTDYVFDGYSVGALGYLIKPPDHNRLDDVLTRALTALHLNADEAFLCRNSEGIYRIPKSSILYFYSEKRLITCIASVRSYTFYARLGEVEQEIGNSFVRIHQRYLVNSAKVDRIDNTEVQVGDCVLPVSRAYQKDAILKLTRALLK